MKPALPGLRDDFHRDPPYPPDYLFPQADWSGLGDLDDLRFLERRLRTEMLIPLSYVRLRERLGFALLTMDMQNRWKDAYNQAGQRNQEAVSKLRAAAVAAAPHRVVLLGALDGFCTLYPDPGVRPTASFRLVAENEAAREAFSAALGDAVEVQGSLTPCGVAVDVASLFVAARPASETPAPTFSGLAITQDAPRLTVDATKTAQDAARGVTPGRPRAAGARPEQAVEKAAAARIDDAPNVLLMRREHVLLLAMLAWAERPPEPRPGLYAWEITEMTRRWPLDWTWLAAEARRWGAHPLIEAVCAEIMGTWRGEVPAEARAALRPGPISGLLLRTLGPVRAQAALRSPFLRRM